MIKSIKLFASVLLVTMAMMSCQDNSEEIRKDIDLSEYKSLSEQVSADLNNLGNNIRNNQTASVSALGQSLYTNGTRQYADFMQASSFISANNGRQVSDLNEVQQNNVNEIIEAVSTSSTRDDFNAYLDGKFADIAGSELSDDDKRYLLTYVTLYKAGINFVAENQDLFVDAANGRVEDEGGWWDSWGKCAASILGGATTGATTLGLAGAAVGTVALPVVGTVAAGTVGVIGGAIGGALTGAAAGC